MDDVFGAVRRTLGPSDKNPIPINALRQLQMTRAKTGGFPMHMYHPTLLPMQAVNEAQMLTLQEMGYTETYIPQSYPKWMHRRNTNSPFAQKTEIGTGNILTHHFVESREVKGVKEEKDLLREKPGAGCGTWYSTIAEVDENDPLDDETAEETQLRIARLEAALAEARKKGPEVPPAV
jgi:hypothetical protein